jgi:hypothetical protein
VALDLADTIGAPDVVMAERAPEMLLPLTAIGSHGQIPSVAAMPAREPCELHRS